MKHSDQKRLIDQLDKLPICQLDWPMFASTFIADGYEFPSASEELRALTGRLASCGIDQLYYRVLRTEEFENGSLTILKAVCPQLEGAWCENWKTNGRAQKRLGQEVAKVSDGNE